MLIVVGRREPNIFSSVAEAVGEKGVQIAKLVGTGLTGGFFGGVAGKTTGLLTNTTR